MWTKIVDLILQWWKDKPRKDLIRNLVLLRFYMLNCQQSYEAYQVAKQQHRGDFNLYAHSLHWLSSLHGLAEILCQVDPVLEIFGPEVRNYVHSYYVLDRVAITRPETVLLNAANALGDDTINIQNFELGPSFKVALDSLDGFIRSNFKIEEISAELNSIADKSAL